MTNREVFYPESRIGGFSDIDGTIAFFNRVNALIQPSFVILDVGCGRGAYGEDRLRFRRELRILKGKGARTIGIDVDPAAQGNPFVDEFRFITGPQWPTEDDSVDLIVCDNVMEHVQDPEAFFAEAYRTLKDGGYLCIRTTNRWHYVALVARVVPNHLHAKVTAAAQGDRKEEDVFPTVYACNSVGALKRMMKRHHFDAIVYGFESEPSYLSFSRYAYALGVMYQKLAPRFFRAVLFAFGKVSKSRAASGRV